MNTKEIIQSLIAKDSNVNNIAELERKLNISNGTINKWDKSVPNSKTLSMIADYFRVSTDFLLNRTTNPSMADKNENAEYDDLVLMFRKNETEVPEERRQLYKKQVFDLMEFVKKTMNEIDDQD